MWHTHKHKSQNYKAFQEKKVGEYLCNLKVDEGFFIMTQIGNDLINDHKIIK